MGEFSRTDSFVILLNVCDFVEINIFDKSNSRRGLSLTTTVYTVSFSNFHMRMILIGIGFDTNYEQITGNLLTGTFLINDTFFISTGMYVVS